MLSSPKIVIPETMTRCRSLPDIPAGEYTDADLAVFIAELEFTAEDCRATLEDVIALIREQQG